MKTVVYHDDDWIITRDSSNGSLSISLFEDNHFVDDISLLKEDFLDDRINSVKEILYVASYKYYKGLKEGIIKMLELIDEIELTDWYHINKNGELAHGANSKEEGTEPLYKAEDILKICEEYGNGKLFGH